MNQVSPTVVAIITTLAQLPAQMVVAWATKNGYSLGPAFDQGLAQGVALLVGMASQRLAVVNQAFDDIVAAGAGTIVKRWNKAPPSPSGVTATAVPAKQAGFAKLGVLLAVATLGLALLLSGCGAPTPKALPDEPTLSPLANESLKAIVSARGVLFAAYDYIDTGTRTGAIEPKQGRAWFVELDKGRDAIAKAQQFWDEGGFDAAKAQAAAQEAIFKVIRDRAIKALEDAAAKKPSAFDWRPLLFSA